MASFRATSSHMDQHSLTATFKRIACLSLLAIAPLSMTACKKEAEDTKAPATPTATATQAKALTPAWQDAHGLCVEGCPAGAPAANKTIDRPIYALSNNPETKFADWVAYVVSAETLGAGAKPRSWRRDPDLPAKETLGAADYEGSHEELGTEMGHQAPLSSLDGSPYWAMANDLSNITPQAETLNNGLWKKLESSERRLVKKQSLVVHSLTGTLYERSMPKLPKARLPHKVPSGYWKVVGAEVDGEFMVASFIMDQTTPNGKSYCGLAVTVRDVEKRSHLNLFPNMEAKRQEALETGSGKLLRKLGCK